MVLDFSLLVLHGSSYFHAERGQIVEYSLSVDIASSNVNRNITLAGTSIAIFTFLLFFLYPRYTSGAVDPTLFQLTLAVIVTTIFSLVISALYAYSSTLAPLLERDPTSRVFGKAEAFWLIGYTLLLLEPSMILFTVNLVALGVYASILWVSSLGLTLFQFRKIRPRKR